MIKKIFSRKRNIVIFIFIALAIIVGLIITINEATIGAYNHQYDYLIKAYENVDYRELTTTNKETVDKYRSYKRKNTILENIKENLTIKLSKGSYDDTTWENYLNIGEPYPSYDSNYIYSYEYQSKSIYVYDYDKNLVTKKDGIKDAIYTYAYGGNLITLDVYKYKTRIVSKYKVEDNELKLTKTLDLKFTGDVMGATTRDNYLYVFGIDNKEEANEVYYDGLASPNTYFKIVRVNMDTFEFEDITIVSCAPFITMNDKYIVLTTSGSFLELNKDITRSIVLDLELNPLGIFVSDEALLYKMAVDINEDTLRIITTKDIEGSHIYTEFDLVNKKKIKEVEDFPVKERLQFIRFNENYCYIISKKDDGYLYKIDLNNMSNYVKGDGPYLVFDCLIIKEFLYAKLVNINGLEYYFCIDDGRNNRVLLINFNEGKYIEDVYDIYYRQSYSYFDSYIVGNKAHFFYEVDDSFKWYSVDLSQETLEVKLEKTIPYPEIVIKDGKIYGVSNKGEEVFDFVE